MKAMPLPVEEFQGKGVLDFSSFSSDSIEQKWSKENSNCYVGSEPTSVLDTRRSPISSTMSSSLGGGSASTDTISGSQPPQAAAPEVATNEKCGGLGGIEDWENGEQSILRLIMGDTEDPSVGLNKLLQSGSGSQSIDFNGASFGGVVDQDFGFEQQQPVSSGNLVSSIDPCSLPIRSTCDFPIQNGQNNNNSTRLGSIQNQNPLFSTSGTNPLPSGIFNQQQQIVETLEEKPQIFNPQFTVNQNQPQYNQNPGFFLPLLHTQMQEHSLFVPPPTKRLNTGGLGPNYPVPKVPFLDSGGVGQEMFLRRHQQQQHQQLPMLPQLLQQRPPAVAVSAKQKLVTASGDDLGNRQLILDHLFRASESIASGNPVLAQGILARLNHQLSPLGKAFHRAAFYFKEALQLLLHMNNDNSSSLSHFSLIFKIGAYKSLSEVSPIVQFANFTCNQALLEALEGFDKIHIIDFDIGCGGQWSSLMQELALRTEGTPTLKITAVASSSSHDQLEIGFTQENLKCFANDLNVPFEIEIVSLESINSALWPLPIHVSDGEGIAVNLPVGSFSNYPLTLPVVLRFVKQLSPKLVVSLDRGCDRTDVPFPYHMVYALQSYSILLESLDAVNMNVDVLQKIERFLVKPSIEKIVVGRHRSHESMPAWRSLFLSSGFSPLGFSNITESQAECLVQRTPVRGFHVEKRQSSLVLCWQRKDLISASAWRC